VLPRVAQQGLADAVDAFCEGIGFSPEQTARMFEAAARHGLPVKLHADQLSNLHGAALAARHGALSPITSNIATRRALPRWRARHGGDAAAGRLLLRARNPAAPVAALRAAGVPIALATDCNPGTSPLTSLLLTMNMGATLFRLTVAECLAGVTVHAARALGLLADRGTLEAGKRCDLAIWDIERPAQLVYRMGFNPLHARIWSGQ
jgi:imidazolonepropionase